MSVQYLGASSVFRRPFIEPESETPNHAHAAKNPDLAFQECLKIAGIPGLSTPTSSQPFISNPNSRTVIPAQAGIQTSAF